MAFPTVAGNRHLHRYHNFCQGLLRQCPNHYAFCVVNLPDKEFRYLRDVIAGAAVHWGLIHALHISS